MLYLTNFQFLSQWHLLFLLFFNFNFRTSWLSSWSLGLFLPMHIDRIASYMVSIPSSCAHALPHIDNKKQLDFLLWTSCIYTVRLLIFNFVLKIRHLNCFSVTVDNIGKFLLTEPEHIRVTRSFVMGILKQPCLKMNMKYSNCAGKTTSIGSILRFLHISSYGISKLATEWVISFKSHQFDWLNLKLIAKQLPLQSKVWDTVRCSIQKSLEGCPAKPVAVF